MNSRSYRLRRLQLEQELGESARRAERNRLEREAALRERTASGIAPVEPAELMALFAGDEEAHHTAWLVLALMTAAQRVNTAIEVAAWLEGEDRPCSWGHILQRWERRLAELLTPVEPALAIEVEGEPWALVEQSPCGRLALYCNGKSLAHEQFIVALDGERTQPYWRRDAAWSYGQRWLEYRLDEEALEGGDQREVVSAAA